MRTTDARNAIHASIAADIRRCTTPIAPGQPTILDLLDQAKVCIMLAADYAEAGDTATAAAYLLKGRALKQALRAMGGQE